MQTVDIEHYKKLIDRFGVEEAYKQRFRCTGRTTRDILRLAHLLSEGQVVHIYPNKEPGKSTDFTKSVLARVHGVCDLLGMQVAALHCRMELVCPQSGGVIRVLSRGCNEHGQRPEKTMEYVLHDC